MRLASGENAAVRRPRIALFILCDVGGGLEQVMLRLGNALLARGYDVDLLLLLKHDDLAVTPWPTGLRIVHLEKTKGLLQGAWLRLLVVWSAGHALPLLWRTGMLGRKLTREIKRLPYLLHYLSSVRPALMLAAWPECTVLACWARRLSRHPAQVVINECTVLSRLVEANVRESDRSAYWRAMPALLGRAYRHADAITAVSDGVADDLARTAGIERDRIETIYNPIVDAELLDRARRPPPHRWLTGGQPPVLLGAGRLHYHKDFATLLRAFARLRVKRRLRLIILGEGEQRQELEALAQELGIEPDIDLPGWVDNPFAYMAHAAVFVLSSRFEGFGNVLAEALACGCPAVSTDCPSGPAEILEQGKYGRLVPVGDVQELATTIALTLDEPPDRAALQARGAQFSVEGAVARYLTVFHRLAVLPLIDRQPHEAQQEPEVL